MNADTPTRRLPAGLRFYVVTIVVLTIASVFAVLYFHFRHLPLDYAMLWSHDDDRYGDFWHYHELFRYFHTKQFFTSHERFAYPAPCAVLYAALYHLPRPHVWFNVLTGLSLLISAATFYQLLVGFDLRRSASAACVLLLALTSYPWERLIDRGNLELFVYIALALGLWATLRGHLTLGACLWGVAGALKIYPLVMLAIYLHRKTMRPLLAGLVTFAGCLLASFWYVGPSIRIAAAGTVSGMTGFVGNYAANARRDELVLDHSILGMLKEFLSMHLWHLGNSWDGLSRGYELCAAIILPIVFFAIVRKLPVLNQIAFLLLALALFTPVSYDYTLIHSYLVLGLFCGAYLYALKHGRILPHLRWFFVAFALLATGETWLRYQSLWLNGPIKCMAMILLCYLLTRVPLTMGMPLEQIWRPETLASYSQSSQRQALASIIELREESLHAH